MFTANNLHRYWVRSSTAKGALDAPSVFGKRRRAAGTVEQGSCKGRRERESTAPSGALARQVHVENVISVTNGGKELEEKEEV